MTRDPEYCPRPLDSRHQHSESWYDCEPCDFCGDDSVPESCDCGRPGHAAEIPPETTECGKWLCARCDKCTRHCDCVRDERGHWVARKNTGVNP